jgi:hypothetical protein
MQGFCYEDKERVPAHIYESYGPLASATALKAHYPNMVFVVSAPLHNYGKRGRIRSSLNPVL